MIDLRIKRAAIIGLLLVVFAPIASYLWDGWMDGTQKDMTENQAKFRAHVQGMARIENEAHNTMAIRESCEKVLRSESCGEPESMSQVEDCLYALSMHRCDSLPEINLCGVVEQIEICGDPFEDQKKNGCSRLRRTASCKEKPAPDDLDKLWRINFDSD